MVATFAFLPSREPENLTRTLNWRQAILTVGLSWLLFGFFGYLKFVVGPSAPDQFIDQFLGPRASVGETLDTSAEMLVLGPGGLGALRLPRPSGGDPGGPVDLEPVQRPVVAALPGGRGVASRPIRGACGGDGPGCRTCRLFTSRSLVRAAARWTVAFWSSSGLPPRPPAALGLKEMRGGWPGSRTRSVWRRPAEIQQWIGQVGPDDGVLAAYEVTAPLSSTTRLYSYILEQNKPKGFPQLGPEFRWVFIRRGDFASKTFEDQGFRIVHRGDFLTILRRQPDSVTKPRPGPRSKHFCLEIGWSTSCLPRSREIACDFHFFRFRANIARR